LEAHILETEEQQPEPKKRTMLVSKFIEKLNFLKLASRCSRILIGYQQAATMRQGIMRMFAC
jgi:hypothetical protein